MARQPDVRKLPLPVFADGSPIPLAPPEGDQPAWVSQPAYPPDLIVRDTQAPEPLLPTESDLGIPFDGAAEGAARHRLVTVGDSITMGFKSLAITDTGLSWPALLAETRTPVKRGNLSVTSPPRGIGPGAARKDVRQRAMASSCFRTSTPCNAAAPLRGFQNLAPVADQRISSGPGVSCV